MPSFTLKNVPDELLDALRAAAEDDRRSLSQEIMHLLTRALRERETLAGNKRAQLDAWRKLAGTWVSDVDFSTETKNLRKRRTRGRKVAL